MAGVCKPAAARLTDARLCARKSALPVHFHTHDTSGMAAASVLAAVEAGADAVDRPGRMSGLTSQPNLGAVVAALASDARDCGLPQSAVRAVSHYWEGVRRSYGAFESDIRSGTADVYQHEMPGGQYTNLREQARSLGIDHRWPEVAAAYAQVNQLFGDIVKVTPTSKVVGDMALFMVTSGLTVDEVMNPERDVAFPESVVALFRGDLGFPPDGFPEAVSRRVLGHEPPSRVRPGAALAPVDLEAERDRARDQSGRDISDDELASWLMYPQVVHRLRPLSQSVR